MLVTLAGPFVIACGSALAVPLGCWAPSPTPPELCLKASVLQVLVSGQSLSCVSLTCVSYWCLCSVCTRSVLASSSCPGCRAVLISAVRTGGWVAASRSQSWDLPGQGQVAGVGPLLPALSIAGLVSVWRWFRGLHSEPFPPLHQVVQVHFLC